MLNNLSFKFRIFFWVTGVVVAAFLAVTWIVSNKTVEMAERDAFALARETAESYKNEIKAELQGARVTAETLATTFETLKRHGLTDRDMMNDILQAALAKKDYITAFCVAYDPGALDGKDAEYAGKLPAYDTTGRYSPYWNKLGDNIAVEPLYDIDVADWYIEPKATKQEYITDPYPYQVQGRSVMLASFVFPIVYQDRFIGIVASDMVLDKLQEMVSRVNPRDQGGRTEILSNSGAVVAHPDKRYLGKDLSETLLSEWLDGRPSGAGDAGRLLRNYLAGQPAPDPADAEAVKRRAGLERLAGQLEAYAANSGEPAPDLALFTPGAAEAMLAADDGRRRYAEEAKAAVRNGESHVFRDGAFYTVYIPIQFSSATRPWSVAVSIPMAEVLKNAGMIRHYVLGLSAVAVCLVALVLYFITTGVTRPILLLARSAKVIGEGDFKVAVPEVRRNDEIGVLAGAIKFMAGKIDEQVGQLKDYARELEDKNTYLNRLNELKDEFLANTSHELRTPINGIIGIAESMVDGATGALTREQKYNLALVANSGKRLSSMINDILDFTKLKNKEIVLRVKPIDLKPIVDTVLVLSKPLTKGKSLELVDELDGGLPLVDADENRIQQILYNLIGNAIKFTESGRIRVSAETRGGMVAVSVSDNGIGIPPDKFDRIFESFEQVDGSTEREYGGTGLGLPISRKLVELHGGTLTVASTPGSGSTFTFTVPASSAEKGSVAPEEGPASILDASAFDDAGEEEAPETTAGDAGGRNRILVVDDEPVNVQVLKNLLRVRNCTVTTAYSGPEALAAVDSGEGFDLILLDVMMPKMSGYDVCRKLREKHSLFELPVLMLTAKNQLHDIVLGFQSGANDYLPKPFDKVELLARVRTLLSLKRAVTTAIMNEKQFENEKQKRILEQTLLEVTNALTSTLDLKEVLAKIVEAMSQFIHFDRSAVLLDDNERFEVGAVSGYDAADLRVGAVVDVAGDPFLSRVVSTGKPVIGGGLASRFRAGGTPGHTLAGVPILYREHLLGIIVLDCRDEKVSNELMATLAGQAGVAIQNARMFTKINVLATTDGLTGLNNRRYFFELVEKEFARFKRYDTPLSVCMMDIDRFKSVNDTYGHAVGDVVLKHLAGQLAELVREYDIVGRYGGEEFAVVLPDTPIDVAAKVAERIRATVEQATVETEEFGPIKYTLSIGVSEFAKDAKSVSAVFEAADKGLYEAKATGRNKVVVK